MFTSLRVSLCLLLISTSALLAASKKAILPPAQIDAFVVRALEQQIDRSKYRQHTDPATITKLLKDAPNYDDIPPHYRALIDANRANYYFNSDKVRNNHTSYYLYYGETFALRYYKGRLAIIQRRVKADQMMAIFARPSKIPDYFSIPKQVMARFTDSDQVYAKRLCSILNANLAFIGNVPFFIPDKDRLQRGDYAGKFIPEKFILQGDSAERIPDALRGDPIDFAYQKIFGYPVYNIAAIEKGRISNSTCDLVSYYSSTKAVKSLTLLQFDCIDRTHRKAVLRQIRDTQYNRAITSMEQIISGIKSEITTQSNNPTRVRICTNALNAITPLLKEWKATLMLAMKKKRFVTTLAQPAPKFTPIDQPRIDGSAETTIGTWIAP